MQSHKLAFKLFTQPGTLPDIDVVVPIFHQWIQNQAVADHLLIDVADYKHVQDGPGVVLVSHQANVNTDLSGGRPGLLYFRKQPFGAVGSTASLEDNLLQTLAAAVKFAQLLERDTPAKFDTKEILFRVHDRLHAPNTAETFAAVKPALQSVATRVLGDGVSLDHKPDPQTLFEVTVRSTSAKSLDEIAALLSPATA